MEIVGPRFGSQGHLGFFDGITDLLGRYAFWKLPGSDGMIKWFDQFRPIHSTSEILCQ
jgi:hypothetical protein